MQEEFLVKAHVGFLKNMLNVLPGPYSSMESNKLTLIYFLVSGLDLLDQLALVPKQEVIDFVYSLQIVTKGENSPGGFRGSSFFGRTWNPACVRRFLTAGTCRVFGKRPTSHRNDVCGPVNFANTGR